MILAFKGKHVVNFQGVSYRKRLLRGDPSLDDQCCVPAYAVDFARKVAVVDDMVTWMCDCGKDAARVFGNTGSSAIRILFFVQPSPLRAFRHTPLCPGDAVRRPATGPVRYACCA